MPTRKVYFVPDPYAPGDRVHIGTVTPSGYQVAEIDALPLTRQEMAILRLAESVLRDWRDTSRLPDACSSHIRMDE